MGIDLRPVGQTDYNDLEAFKDLQSFRDAVGGSESAQSSDQQAPAEN
jgi:hypothetical protein